MANNQQHAEVFLRLSKVSIVAGLCLALLLPAALLSGFSSWLYYPLFLLHLFLQAYALVLAAKVVADLLFNSEFQLLWLLLILCVMAFLVVEGLAPPTARDALIYHLAVPKLWLQQGSVVELPWHQWSYHPMLVNMAYAGFLGMGCESIFALYHATYLLLMAAVVAAFLRSRSGSDLPPLLGFVLILTLPVCLRVGSTPLVDVALAMFFSLAYCLFLFQFERKEDASNLLFWIGASLGLGLSTKYNGLLGMLVFCMIAPFYLSRVGRVYLSRVGKGFGHIVRAMLVIGIVAVVVYSPWLLRNYVWTGNPIYPEFNRYFVEPTPGPRIGATYIYPLQKRVLLHGESLLEIALIPLRMLVFGKDGSPKYFDAVLSPILVLGFFGVFLFRSRPWAIFAAANVAVYFLLAFFLTSTRTRYLAPVLAPVILLTAEVLIYLWERRENLLAKVLIAGFLGVHLFWVGSYCWGVLVKTQSWQVLSGAVSREQYLQRRVSEYAIAQFANEKFGPEDQCHLLYTGNRFYYYDVDVRGVYESAVPLLRTLHQSSSAQDFAQRLADDGYTCLIAHTGRTRRAIENLLRKPELKEIWDAFASSYLELIYHQGEFAIWKLRSVQSDAERA